MDTQQWIGALVDRYEHPLCRYALGLTGSVSAAQDAVQETFLRLCRARRERIEGREAAWLFRVCRSRVCDMRRKENPVQWLNDQDSARIPSPEPSPAEQASLEDAKRLLPRLLAQLPDRQREAIRLKFQQDLSYRDIAHVMRTSEGNVGFMLHQGLKALRSHLDTLQGAAP